MASSAFAVRASARSKLEGLSGLDDEARESQRMQILEQLTQDSAAIIPFRYHAPSSQRRQDHHWNMYKLFLCTVVEGKAADNLPDDDDPALEELMFPSTFNDMRERLSMFVAWVLKNARPRLRASEDKTIAFSTLTQYKDSMMFWAERTYRLRDEDLHLKKLHDALVRAVRYAYMKYGNPVEKGEKSWLGLPELRELLDHEMVNNRCIELSEQHQTLWCLGRITALRPGSLCPSQKAGRDAPLKWRNLEFKAGEEPGRFTMRLTLPRLDLKRPSDPFEATKQGATTSPVSVSIDSPEPYNIIFSPVHRLLVIALRRGILEDHATVAELLGSDKAFIRIKKQHLDENIFLAGSRLGTSIQHDRPMQTHALTSYLQLRGNQLGYPVRLTWYSIRRRAATDMVARVGFRLTRIFMGHQPDSQTLERYYLNLMESMDLTSNLLDQDTDEPAISKKKLAEFSPSRLYKIDEEGLARTKGRALRVLVQRLVLSDPNPPDLEDEVVQRNYRARVRKIAQDTLFAQEAMAQKERLTKAELDERARLAMSSDFAEKVFNSALESMSKDQATEEDTDDDRDDHVDLFTPLDDSDPATEPAEQDLEQNLNQDWETDESGAIKLSLEADSDPAALGKTPKEVPYVEMANAFMNLLMDNSVSNNKPWSQKQQTCQMCQDDDTTDSKHKNQKYASADKLKAHQEGRYHDPVERWKRQFLQESDESGGGNELFCPFCTKAELDPPFKTPRIDRIVTHIVRSDAATHGEVHDGLKADAGFYDPEFLAVARAGPSDRSLEKYALRGNKRLKTFAIDTSPERQLIGTEPYEHSTTIVRGSHEGRALDSRYDPFIDADSKGQHVVAPAIPPHLQDYITKGFQQTPTDPLPAYMRDDVVVTRTPRSAEDYYRETEQK